MGHDILGDGHGSIKIDDSMLPPARDEDCISGTLDEFDDAQLVPALGLDDLGEDFGVVVDGLILIFGSPEGLAFDNELGDALWEQHPPLVALQGGIPRRGVQEVGVHSRPRALRTH